MVSKGQSPVKDRRVVRAVRPFGRTFSGGCGGTALRSTVRTKEHLNDRSGDGDVDGMIQLQLLEDGGGSTEQS